MNHSLYSDEYNRRNENFNKGIVEMDKKYIDFFSIRPHRSPLKKHDSIYCHFIITKTESTPQINIHSTELPQEIKDDLLNLFHQHWG
jgi:hypothetical protein